jgi:hypothetical protein
MDILDEVIENICKNNLTRKVFLDNFKQITVVVDEMIDNGLVFNTDSENIEQRLNMKESNVSVSSSGTSSNEGGYFSSVFLFYITTYIFRCLQKQRVLYSKIFNHNF